MTLKKDQTRLGLYVIIKWRITMHITNISEAKTTLSQLIKQVQASHEPIIIGKAGKPIAILSAFIEDDTPRELGGSWEGKVKIAKDFDETGDELIESFYNSELFPSADKSTDKKA